MPNAGLLSMTFPPPAMSIFRERLFSALPLRRLGFNMIRTSTPRFLAAMTAFRRPGSEKTNIFTRSDFFALFMASMMGFAESSGKTINERDMKISLADWLIMMPYPGQSGQRQTQYFSYEAVSFAGASNCTW